VYHGLTLQIAKGLAFNLPLTGQSIKVQTKMPILAR